MPVVTESRAPGVYLEQVRIPAPPALETGVPVFLGRLSPKGAAHPLFAGRAGRPVTVDEPSWAALDAAFGAGWAEGTMGFSVRGFFENGGRRCHVAPHAEGALGAALDDLKALDDFDLVCAPDAAGDAAAHELILRLCGERPGCFALLDTPGARQFDPAVSAASLLAMAAALRGRPVGPNLVNGALYGPWIKVRGACSLCAGSGCASCHQTGQGMVPPSGHVAGIAARLDNRVGVHRAPANEPMEGVVDVQLALDDSARSKLGAAGVNGIVALPGRGIRPWGARTLAPTDPQFSHVSSRRTYLTVLRWLELMEADICFEPNDLRLWLRVGRRVKAFLDGLYQQGALIGASADEAFYVKCDGETNPPEVREAGKVVTEIGLSLARPTEFVVLRLVTFAGTAGAGAA